MVLRGNRKEEILVASSTKCFLTQETSMLSKYHIMFSMKCIFRAFTVRWELLEHYKLVVFTLKPVSILHTNEYDYVVICQVDLQDIYH